jgi:hypothetical protein
MKKIDTNQTKKELKRYEITYLVRDFIAIHAESKEKALEEFEDTYEFDEIEEVEEIE